jgi:hypothetical protein
VSGRPPSSPLSGLVLTTLIAADDVQPVVGVDEGDGAHQRGELVGVVMLGRVRPGLVGDTAGGVGDAGALLGKLKRGLLGVGEDLRVGKGRKRTFLIAATGRVRFRRCAVNASGESRLRFAAVGTVSVLGAVRAGGVEHYASEPRLPVVW